MAKALYIKQAGSRGFFLFPVFLKARAGTEGRRDRGEGWEGGTITGETQQKEEKKKLNDKCASYAHPIHNLNSKKKKQTHEDDLQPCY